jgi:transposase-like protein
MGVNEDGRRKLLGLKVGDNESEPCWAESPLTSKGEASLASSW